MSALMLKGNSISIRGLLFEINEIFTNVMPQS